MREWHDAGDEPPGYEEQSSGLFVVDVAAGTAGAADDIGVPVVVADAP